MFLVIINWLDMEIIRDVPNAASTYYQQ